MILELDAGNTRIKWRLANIKDGALLKNAEGCVLATSGNSAVFTELENQINQNSVVSLQRVRVSSVRGAKFNTDFSSWVKKHWQLQAELAEVVSECGGIRNSYVEVSKMGVDRWLAMLAAYNEAKAFCCVVDFGSAITLDLIGKDGQHLGGYIVPGFGVMQEALVRKSPVLGSNESAWDSIAPANNTGDAVRRGLLAMVLGMIEKVRDEYKGRETINWFFTGGDAALISPQINWQHKVVPDLVMDGLAISVL